MDPNEEVLKEDSEAEEILPEEADKIAGGGAGYGNNGSEYV
jgi:hypothetical protein